MRGSKAHQRHRCEKGNQGRLTKHPCKKGGIACSHGDPAALYARLPHPVVVIGRGIGSLDRRLNRERDRAQIRRAAGIAACLLLAIASLAVGWLLHGALQTLPGGWLAEALLISALLAQNSLYRHVAAVARGLAQEGVAGGRRAVARIVGRDPESLDEAGVARAALESLADYLLPAVEALKEHREYLQARPPLRIEKQVPLPP